MTPIVLVHGGGTDRRTWDLLVPHLEAPALAVDLPGRGRHPAALSDVDFAACAQSVLADVDGAGFDEVVLVGHSLAGCSMPAMIGALGDRVRHAVFVACTVPEDGTSALDTLDPEVQALVRSRAETGESTSMDEGVAEIVFGDDLDDAQIAWCVERLVPEAPRLATDPVDLAPLRSAFLKRTWVRTGRDLIVAPEKQLRFAGNLGGCDVIELDAGHMCMVSQPEATASILDALAAS